MILPSAHMWKNLFDLDSGKWKVAGVYQIENKMNQKKYIEVSDDLCLAIFGELCALQNRKHTCTGLRMDYLHYGLTAFNVSILEIVEIKKGDEQTLEEKLYAAKEKWMDKYSVYQVYNKPIVSAIGGLGPSDFLVWIAKTWAVGIGVDRRTCHEKKIWNDQQKKEIVEMAIRCGFASNTKNTKVTFWGVIRNLVIFHGFSVDEGSICVNKKNHRYVLLRKPIAFLKGKK